ncbi:hypothetical protein HPB50_001970 [Hyalomma asiaticum]|uniref:Uncharacterized protein n=1 Tax=Hyalomma asiaticum TaxID=266040 RepID=A0ACB7RQ46_HYAAI|nr:hypothetical protein HPB50_001970 [Hyalomma asiaticum]
MSRSCIVPCRGKVEVFDRQFAPRNFRTPDYPPPTHNDKMPTADDLMARLDRIKTYCAKYAGTLEANSSWGDPLKKSTARCNDPPLYIISTSRFSFCSVPKAASTSLKTLLLRLEHYPTKIRHADFIFRMFERRFRHSCPSEFVRDRRIADYTKLIIVRHPFERLVSAFVDKIRTTKPRMYGAKLIYAQGFRGSGPNGTYTFAEFVKIILDTPLHYWDPHWAPYTTRCRPCAIRYDFILKVETLHRDLDFFLPRIGLAGWSFPRENVKSSSNDGVAKHYITQLTRQQELVSADANKIRTTRLTLTTPKKVYKGGSRGTELNGTFTFAEFVKTISGTSVDSWNAHWDALHGQLFALQNKFVPCSFLTSDRPARVQNEELRTVDDLAARLARIGTYCAKYASVLRAGNSSDNSVGKSTRECGDPPLYTADTRRLAFCSIPKAATTSLKTLLLLAENVSVTARDSDSVFEAFRQRFRFFCASAFTRDRSVADYIKVVIVRHPFERLVSAYVNKIRTTRPTLGAAVEFYKRGFRGSGPNGTFTFAEFVKIILKKPADSWEPHWAPYTARCRPCSIRYDLILKVETLRRDMDLLLPRIGLTGWSFPKENAKTAANVAVGGSKRYLAELTRQQLLLLHAIYMYDFELFGYTLEGYVDPIS